MTDDRLEGALAFRAWPRYAAALVISAVTTLIAIPLHHAFELSNIVMLYLLAVVPVAMRLGRGPSVLAAVVNVLAFDWFFVPPQYTFAVTNVQYVFTFIVMLIVGLVIGQLTAGLRDQARFASQAEERARRLFDMARELSAAAAAEQVAEIGQRFVTSTLRGKTSILILDEDEVLSPPTKARDLPDVDMAVARWLLDPAGAAGLAADALPAAGKLYLPLKAPLRTRGVLVVEPLDSADLMLPEQRRLLETCAALIAIALERVHFVAVAQRSLVDMESERLRSSVLAALSHDLRTPLTALVGLSETLANELAREAGPAGREEKALAIRNQARRTAKLVDNLLEMARLEVGRTPLRKDWQSLEELVGGALAMLEPALAARDVEVGLPTELPLVLCDGVLIERVLYNLVENATKYTPADSPIRIAAHRSGDVVEVIVEDRGPGLPVGQERAIFDKFTRGDPESVVPGVGLGLAICRAIVEAHRGTILAVNRDGGGARFSFTLPAEEPPSEAEAGSIA
jgi:two-component system sensor histidine kinase KdpD